jgi:4-hydroxythreonine-4-phosphate dehydrogenase
VITPGDPTGIGPEITVKALARLHEFQDTQFIVVGSLPALESAAALLHIPLPQEERVRYQPIEADKPGMIAYKALDVATRMIASNEALALVTGPISKQNLKAADIDLPGHTEILEHFANKYFGKPNGKSANENTAPLHKAEMLFVHKNFRLLLLTRHIPLHDVPKTLARPGAVAGPIKTLIAFLRHRLGIDEPHLVMLGINPHAGEIGDDDKKIFMPVINAVNQVGASRITGPVAADGFFRGFDPEKPGCDAIVAAYHDQGLVPMKILAGHAAVNMTIGLPFLRTSVSHGTAEDIVGRGVAKEDSLIAALHTARESL